MTLRYWKVTPDDIQPEVNLVLTSIVAVKMSGSTFWVTAITNGEHMEGSLHYEGFAVDGVVYSGGEVNAQGNTRLTHLLQRNLLPDGYDVILEDRGTGNEHIHIEFDPDY